jgi:hypothetical protein
VVPLGVESAERRQRLIERAENLNASADRRSRKSAFHALIDR